MAGATDGTDEKTVAPIRSAAVKNGRNVGRVGRKDRLPSVRRKKRRCVEVSANNDARCGKPTVINAPRNPREIIPSCQNCLTENDRRTRLEYDFYIFYIYFTLNASQITLSLKSSHNLRHL